VGGRVAPMGSAASPHRCSARQRPVRGRWKWRRPADLERCRHPSGLASAARSYADPVRERRQLLAMGRGSSPTCGAPSSFPSTSRGVVRAGQRGAAERGSLRRPASGRVTTGGSPRAAAHRVRRWRSRGSVVGADSAESSRVSFYSRSSTRLHPRVLLGLLSNTRDFTVRVG
jgi:hypothetical protein